MENKKYGLMHLGICGSLFVFFYFLIKYMETTDILSEANTNTAPFPIRIIYLIVCIGYICFAAKKVSKIKFGHFIHNPLRLAMFYILYIFYAVLSSGGAVLWLLLIVGPFMLLSLLISFINGIRIDAKYSRGDESDVKDEEKSLQNPIQNLFCPKCHYNYKKGDIYCENCGFQIHRNPKYDKLKIIIVFAIITLLVFLAII